MSSKVSRNQEKIPVNTTNNNARKSFSSAKTLIPKFSYSNHNTSTSAIPVQKILSNKTKQAAFKHLSCTSDTKIAHDDNDSSSRKKASAPITYSNKSLQDSFYSKKKHLDDLKRAILEKQKPLIETYKKLKELKVKLENSGTLVSLEPLQLIKLNLDLDKDNVEKILDQDPDSVYKSYCNVVEKQNLFLDNIDKFSSADLIKDEIEALHNKSKELKKYLSAGKLKEFSLKTLETKDVFHEHPRLTKDAFTITINNKEGENEHHYRKKINQLERDLVNARRKIDRLEVIVKNHGGKAGSGNKNFLDTTEVIKKLQSKVESKHQETLDLEKKVVDLKVKLASTNEKRNQLTSIVTYIEKELTVMKAQISQIGDTNEIIAC